MAAGLVFAKMPRNAYLLHRPNTTQGLVNEVEKQPAVADRYMRHFSMSKSEVEDYFSTLKLERLTAPGMYVVYSVPKGGWIKSHTQKLARGEEVWADPSGTPVLMYVCGNPLKPIGSSQFDLLAQTRGHVSGGSKGGVAIPGEAPIPLMSPPNEIALVPSIVSPPEALAVVPQPAGQFQTAKSSRSDVFLPLLGLAALVVVSTNNHHSCPPVQAVPAPTSALVLGIPVLALLASKRRIK